MSEITRVLTNQWDVDISVSVEQLRTKIAELNELEVSNEGIIQAITGVFSNAFNSLRNVVNKALALEEKEINIDVSKFNKFSSSNMKSNYAYLIDRQVSVPAGLKGTYIDYATVSFKLSEVTKQVPLIVEQLRADIGRVISTPGGLKDSTLFSDNFYVNAKKELDKNLNDLSKVRKGDEFNAVRSYGDVFRNNTEFFNSVEITSRGNTNVNKVSRRALLNNIETTMQYVQELSVLAKSGGYSKPMVAKIGNCVAYVAEIVEAFSASVFNQEMLTRSLNNVIDELDSVIK